MFIGLSFVLGLLTDWWWAPVSFGIVGEAIHYAGSASYRYEVHHARRGTLAVILSAALLTCLCLAAYGIGTWAASFLPAA